MSDPIALVTLDWLVEHFEQDNLVLLDASVKKVVGKEPVEYDEFCCIPDSQLCDLDLRFHDHSATQPHTMPEVEQFIDEAQQLGINKDSLVVIYDNQGIYSAPRAWWMFKSFGFDNVFVLDGGLPNWALQGHDLLDSYMAKEPQSLELSESETKSTQYVASKEQVLATISQPNSAIIDARGAGRFNGTAPEPRPGLRSGHIPSSINIHFEKLLTDDGLFFKSNNELQNVFAEAGITDSSLNITVSCGSGMTACIVILAAYEIGFRNLKLYDGSWSEWGADCNLPIE